jgi:trigger factor
MDVSVESVTGLTRRVSVSIPKDHVEQQIQERLKHLASKVKLDGFRPGKAPLNLVKKQYLATVRGEVAQNLLEETLPEALQQKSLSPVSSPSVEKFEMESGKNFNYTVSFEVLPEFNIVEPDNKIKIDWLSAQVKPADVDAMIEKLQGQNKTWATVTRAAKKSDQVKIDFDGSVDGTPIEQGKATDFSMELGAGQMIPGFEDELIGHKAGESFTIQVAFPKDYHEKNLAGKKAKFDIVMHEVQEAVLPELNAEFVKKFGVESGKIEDLRTDITTNMERELTRRLREINNDACFDALAELNQFDIPSGLVDKEIEHLKHEMFHRIFGAQHSDNEKIPDFPRELFEERAKKRVHLGLLFSEYVKKHSLIADGCID